MSTEDQKLSAVIRGEAFKFARDEIPQEMLDRIAAAAEGRDELRVKTAGAMAGSWMASPATHLGHELIAAGLLLFAGVVDGDELVEAVQTGYERGKGRLRGYDPTDATD